MLAHKLLRDEGILIVRPEGPLSAADFEAVAGEVDPYIEQNGILQGLVIEAEKFPGWEDFAGLVSHLRFIHDHHNYIAKVAAVTDSGFLSIMPRVVDHFITAEVRHFEFADRAAALVWVGEA